MTGPLPTPDVQGRTQTPPEFTRRILILANPTASHFKTQTLSEIVTRLEAIGSKVELRLTRHVGEIAETCAHPELDVDIVAVAGGDGSINEAAQALQERAFKPALAIIPFGTANVLASELNIPSNPKDLAHLLATGKTRKLHHGLANGRPFYIMASTGFDAEVVHLLPLRLKRKLGKLAYINTALRLAWTRRRCIFRVKTEGEMIECRMVIAANGKHYGGRYGLFQEGSVLEDGLTLVLLAKDNPVALMRYGIRLWMGTLHRAKDVQILQTKQAYIESYKPAAVQIDGEPYGGTPLEITVGRTTLPILATA
ncbi:diacylglycerol/lipid kinase family protein [Pseudovibrio sp. SPO723]|uniref:diacylglycerol/lipid kinase family protein n=1 Tax=Nesiotobacter zosterae TaxID=392721 RepID=UPI0029C3BA71|nr:YegS/Rv2252/BmrU family lipid kinase [Pseudovibrio sp. SPO723]MDX5593026.1 YegS/Rv2252/BmrU family lipid kinase [Pseudovibrio sp. SPO723]